MEEVKIIYDNGSDEWDYLITSPDVALGLRSDLHPDNLFFIETGINPKTGKQKGKA